MATVQIDGKTVRVNIRPITRPVVIPVRPQTVRVTMRNSNVGTEGAAPTVDSVNGQQGDVVLTKNDIGLGNVDNTSDAAKPVSTATQTALDGKSNTGHTHAQSEVTGLPAALSSKADAATTYSKTEVDTALSGKASTGYVDSAVAGVVNSAPAVLNTLGELAVALGNDPNFATTIAAQIGGKANAVHSHAIADTTGLQTALDSKAPQATTYTKTEVDTALAGKSSTGHTHAVADTTGLQTALDGKAATSHTHTKAQITDFAHTHPVAEVTGLGTAATKDVASSGDATAGQVVQGSDSRLTDARTPTAHTHAQSEVTGLVAALAGKAATTHGHNITDVTGLQTALNSNNDMAIVMAIALG